MESTKRHNRGGDTAFPDSKHGDHIAHTTAIDGARLSAEDVRTEKRASRISANHEFDPNLPTEKRLSLQEAIDRHDVEAEREIIEGTFEDDSPYPEVRAAVRNYDEDVPASTIRAWVIGMTLTTLGSGINMLFSLRSPAISVNVIVALLVAYPLGKLWARFMPQKTFRTFGQEWSLNPGPFNMKEHTIIVVMANASFASGAAYSTDTLVAQIVKYKQDFGWGFALTYTVSMMSIGYGLAGICRRFLVYPSSMIWPTNLVSTTLFYTLHKNEKPDPVETDGWKITRYKFFMWLSIAGIFWYFFPGYIFMGLSMFAFVTWIKPGSVIVNQVFGMYSGFGILPLTFDWGQVGGYLGSPLPTPLHAIANTMIGLVVFFLVLTPILHYNNVWDGQYFPLFDPTTYDNTGNPYNVSRITTPERTLNVEEYKAYSPLYISTAFALCYGLSFAGIASTISHTILFHGKEIMNRFRNRGDDEEDVHMRLMRKYKEVPDWQYGAIFLVMLGLSFVTVLAYDTHLTWWAHLISILMAAIWLIPVGLIQATTNIQIGLNVITEFVIGYMTPGLPLAMMLFKSYGYIGMSQALSFTQDLKLGHYMKVPPRAMFWAQIVATTWSGIVQVAVMYWALGNIPGVCTPAQKDSGKFTCPYANTFFSASVIWGLVGPGRMFSPGAIYSPLLWFFLIGAIAPVFVWFAVKKWPNSPVRYLNMPVIFSGTGMIPPATPANYIAWGVIGAVFNGLIRRRWFGWWKTYNFVTSAGLDIGLAFGSLIVFFCLQYHGIKFNWWGNTHWEETLDVQGMAVRAHIAEGEHFGPTKW